MTARLRIQDHGTASGTCYLVSTGQTVIQTQDLGEAKCEDHVFSTRSSDNPFSVTKSSVTGGIMNGSRPGNSVFTNWPVVGASTIGPSSISGEPSNAMVAAKVLAGSNPSQPSVDLPAFVGELKDFPRLLRLEGDWLMKLGGANLSYHFGWKPLISDLLTLAMFQTLVDKRVKELKALSKRASTRKRDVFSESITNVRKGYVLSSLGGVTQSADVTTTTSVRKWGYARWQITTPLPTTEAEMLALARRATLGLYVSPATFWELLPWTWLIDWCSNVGDLLNAGRNIVGASPSACMVCRHLRSESDFKMLPTGRPVTTSHAKNVTETKSRVHAIATLSASLPFLTYRQASILGSIGVTRRVGGR